MNLDKKTFAPINLTGNCPECVCPECAKHGVLHRLSGVVYGYCQHSQTGVILRDGLDWMLFDDCSHKEFMLLILEAVITVEIAEDIVASGLRVQ